jgi:hypothetical protein
MKIVEWPLTAFQNSNLTAFQTLLPPLFIFLCIPQTFHLNPQNSPFLAFKTSEFTQKWVAADRQVSTSMIADEDRHPEAEIVVVHVRSLLDTEKDQKVPERVDAADHQAEREDEDDREHLRSIDADPRRVLRVHRLNREYKRS